MQQLFKMVIIAGIAVIFPFEAEAYFDPITGTIIINWLIAVAIGAAAVIKGYWYQIKALLKFPRTRENNRSDFDNIDDVPQNMKSIVFYAEDNVSYQYLKPIIEYLTEKLNRDVCYLTSSKNDPTFTLGNERVRTFFIGEGMKRNLVFRSLDTKVMVMTAPDLDTYQLKRSLYPVHYVYVFHNMVSTHMTFTETAFDKFDTVFCVGPHHVAEIREAETRRALPPKELFCHGYGRLDEILATGQMNSTLNNPNRILIAPSWGANGILEMIGTDIIEILLGAGYVVTVRPHPNTRQNTGHVLDEIDARFGENQYFTMNENTSSLNDLYDADVLISDWSGVAMEFAFGLERPVVFIDVPRKELNPNFDEFETVPLEVQFRSKVGTVVSPDELDTLPSSISNLLADGEAVRQKIKQCRERWIFNIGSSGKAGAEKITSLVDSKSDSTNPDL